jgi:hypothetical protein
MYRQEFCFFIDIVNESNGIDTAMIFSCGPIKFIEQVEDIGVNDCEDGLSEGDFAKG